MDTRASERRPRRESTEVVVIGGGHAGLSVSRLLRAEGREHVVLERGRVAERWRSERWDSLHLLTPNWLTRLPSWHYQGTDQDGFMSAAEFIAYLERYSALDSADRADVAPRGQCVHDPGDRAPHRPTLTTARDLAPAQDGRPPLHGEVLMSTRVDTPAPARRLREGTLNEAVDGAIAATSLMLGYLPFAIMIGVAAGLSSDPLAAWAGSLLLFAGSSQLAAFELVSDGAGIVPIITTVALINARLSLYSLSLLPLWGGASLRGRLLVAATVIDPTWMLALRRGRQLGELGHRRAHYVGTALGVALVWVTSIGIGVLLGARAQGLAVLAIALPVVMAAIVVQELRQRGGLACAAAAAATVPLTAHWPGGTDFLAAMVVGACAGIWASRRASTS